MSVKQPLLGRFADPENAAPENDARLDPRLMEAVKTFGMGGRAPQLPMDPATASLDELVACAREAEKGFEGLYQGLVAPLPAEDGAGVEYTLEHAINPEDGAKVELHIHRSAGHSGPLPAVIYFHGGGMTMLSTYNEKHRQWAHDLARQGLVAINVGFRNAGTDASGSTTNYLHFPTPLNDCIAALRYVNDSRGRLSIGRIIAMGESGGGNLSIASTLKLRRDGHTGVVDGVYVLVPFVSGVYRHSTAEQLKNGLGSLVENDGYFITVPILAVMAGIYDPTHKNDTNPLAWPLQATEEEFQGFPPIVISVDEVDPLRDEGMHLARKMARAGVHVVSRMNLGMLHATEIWKPFCPEIYDMTIADIKRFAYSID